MPAPMELFFFSEPSLFINWGLCDVVDLHSARGAPLESVSSPEGGASLYLIPTELTWLLGLPFVAPLAGLPDLRLPFFCD